MTKSTTVKPNTKKNTQTPKQKANAVPLTLAESNIPKEMDTLFTRILNVKRNHTSAGEKAFCDWLMEQMPETAFRDEFGNIHCPIGVSKTMFCAHVDTMHKNTGVETQPLIYDPVKDQVFVDNGHECLGADDGSGIWIMLQMIEHNVPGYYVFHRGEERGAPGSRWIMSNMKSLLKTMNHAVAFDRKGQTDIITHQGGTRTASETFANALANALNEQDATFNYKPCDGGSFTDTKVYEGIIPECTNISVGYYHQHGPNECQDVQHLFSLAQSCILVEWDKLPALRDPKKVEHKAYKNTSYNTGWYQQHNKPKVPTPSKPPISTPSIKAIKSGDMLSMEDMEWLMKRFPHAVMGLMEMAQFTWDDVEDALEDYYSTQNYLNSNVLDW